MDIIHNWELTLNADKDGELIYCACGQAGHRFRFEEQEPVILWMSVFLQES